MITYSKATADDIPPAIALWLKIWDEFIVPAPKKTNSKYDEMARNSNLLKRYESDERIMLLAKDGERIVGVIGADVNQKSIKPPLCVDCEYHRQGIATELLNCMICELKTHGCDVIKVNSSNYALPFYMNFGFIQTGPEQKLDGFDIAHIPMEYTFPNTFQTPALYQ